MEGRRPWKTDAELEADMRQRPTGFAGFGGGGSVVVTRAHPPKPWGTYGLLIAFLVVYVLELIIYNTTPFETFRYIFTIYSIDTNYDWVMRPWSPFTATMSHSPVRAGHIIFNGLALYFFGPHIELRFGRVHFLTFFLAAGAASSIIQAVIAPNPALGASGAIMGIIGLTIILEPKARILMFPFPTPIPLWVAGILFALIDVAGAMSGSSGIGNFAHLAGMALGLAWGYVLKQRTTRRRPGFVAP
ncbi:MAG TPA: rhomboid family intramembrane serine protease [Candidatus Thermoplasmatota archaeon]|nr:rhomboid family intramembrane serine protease [Candidatus Thermoplasmatota archaeon]